MPATDDLIAKALRDRAATVTQANLERPDLVTGPTGGERTWRRWAPRPSTLLAAAASVLAVPAIVLAVTALRGGGEHQNPASGGDPATLTGVRWQLAGVRSATKSYPVPTNYRAEFRFDKNGYLSGLDGLNALAGTYRTAGNKLTIRVTAAGTAGGTGTFPALEAMSSTYTPTSLNDDSVTSTYTLTPRTLVLDTGQWTVTFSAQGTSTLSTPASPTSTKQLAPDGT
jgi:heat shock protein HslJ